MKRVQMLCNMLGVLLAGSFLVVAGGAIKVKGQSVDNTNGKMSVEERLVRLTYMKLSMYNQSTNIYNSQSSKKAYRISDNITFKIAKVRTGAISEILDMSYGSLVSRPKNEIVVVMPGILSSSPKNGSKSDSDGIDRDVEITYEAEWEKAPYFPGDFWEKPFREIKKLAGDYLGDVEKYTSYEVEVSLAGKTHSYNALALHHGGLQSSDNINITFADYIVGSKVVLSDLLYEDRPPVFGRQAPNKAKESVGGDLGEKRNPRTIGGVTQGSARKLLNAPALNCDFSSLKCCWTPGFTKSSDISPSCSGGLEKIKDGEQQSNYESSQVSLRNADSCPIGGCRYDSQATHRRSNDKTGNEDHIIGSHSSGISFSGNCIIQNDCNVQCSWSEISLRTSESFFYLTESGIHKGFSGRDRDTAVNPPVSGNPHCRAIGATAIKSCLLGLFCGAVTFNFSHVSVTFGGSPIFTHSVPIDIECVLQR